MDTVEQIEVQEKEQVNDVEEEKEELTEEESKLKDLTMTTRQIMDEMQWLMNMFYLLGEAEAKGIKTIRDETTGTIWNASALNKKKRNLVKSSTTVINGNYTKLFKKKPKKKRKHVPRKEGAINNFSKPVSASQAFVDFINSSDLGEMEYKGRNVKVQSIVTGLERKDRIMSSNIMRTLFAIWANMTPMKKNNKVIWPTQFNNKRVCVTDPNFKKYFDATMKETIAANKVKNPPALDYEITINEGKEDEMKTVVFYRFINPIGFQTIVYKHESNIEIKDKEGKPDPERAKGITERLVWEHEMLREYLHKIRGDNKTEDAVEEGETAEAEE